MFQIHIIQKICFIPSIHFLQVLQFLYSWTKGDECARVTPCPSLYLLTLVWVEFFICCERFTFSSFLSYDNLNWDNPNFWQGHEYSFFGKVSRPALWPSTAFYQIGTGGSLLREKVLKVPTIADVNVKLFLYWPILLISG